MKINKKLIIPVVLALLTYLLSYEIPRHFITPERLNYPSIPLDYKLPFIPAFVIVYVLAYLQWIISALIIIKQDTRFGYKYCSAIIIGSLIGFVIFMVYPSAVNNRVLIDSDSLLVKVIHYIYKVDKYGCVFPSFHCFLSTISCYIVSEAKLGKIYEIGNIIFSILVYLSTVFVKQHFVLDILGGILIAIFAVYISNKHQFTKIYNFLNKKLINEK